MDKRTGAKIILEALGKENVDYIFGYQGGMVIPIFHELELQNKIKIIIPRHEQGAIHAADGYARATGKVGVCLATSGPGATNLVTGLITAHMDSIPIVAITGQVASHLIGNDAFQEADVTGITMSATKHNYLVKDIEKLPRILKEAFYIAKSGRPGPVLIDIPSDIINGSTNTPYPDKVNLNSYKPQYTGNKKQIKEAAKIIKQAKYPMVYAGGGITSSNASAILRKFVTKTGIPVTTTLIGLGIYPTDDKLFLGMPGMHGTAAANFSFAKTDLIIAVGVRFDDRVTGSLEKFAKNAKIIHIDIDPTSISKNILAHVPIVGDAKSVLEELINHVDKAKIPEWINEIEGWKKDYPMSYSKKDKEIKPQQVLEILNDLVPNNTIYTTEVGQHQMWAAQFLRLTKPRTFITSGGLGTMGFGLPAAIGAQFGAPNSLVVDISGDGSIQMNIQELATISNYKLPVKILILNNHYLGMVRQWQELFFDKVYAGTSLKKEKNHKDYNNSEDKSQFYTPDFVKLGDAYGIASARIVNNKDIEKGLKKMIEHKGGYILEVQIATEENVMPMVPTGGTASDMLFHQNDSI